MPPQRDRLVTPSIDALIAGLLTAKPHPAVEQIERSGLWESVAAGAWQSRVGGLLIHHLRLHGIVPPESAARQLDAYLLHVRAANAYASARVGPVLAGLQAGGIRFLVLKGAALGTVLYHDPGLRPMVDVDLLIRPADAARAQRLMARCGCTPGPDLVRGDFFPKYHYEREYFTADRPPVKIDLHVRPFRPLRFARTVPEDALWDDPQTARFGDLQIDIPNPRNMLIHLAVHAACHGLRELRWLSDIKYWQDRFSDQIDWDSLVSVCRRWKLILPVRRALAMVARTFETSDPLSEPRPGRMSAGWNPLDRLALWQAPYGEQRPVADVLVNCFCTPGLRYRLGYLGAVLLPTPTHMGQLYGRRHPGWLLAAHAVRVLRGLARPLMPRPATEAG